jgi:glycogen debranching enzyme
MGSSPIHGYIYSDVRVLADVAVTTGTNPAEHITTTRAGADSAVVIAAQRELDDEMPDPRVRIEHRRSATTHGIDDDLTLVSGRSVPVTTTVTVTARADLTGMDRLRAGLGPEGEAPRPILGSESARWSDDTMSVELACAGARIEPAGEAEFAMSWEVTVPPEGTVTVSWTTTVSVTGSIVRGADGPVPWSVPTVAAADPRLSRWITSALDDLDALRLSATSHPDDVFIAAGAPWFFTLFGRDALWTARMMLPLGTELAGGTLRVLAGLQGNESVSGSAEQPGKIMHELRRGDLPIHGGGVLPPLYYGTVDATPLWVCLLHDAWRWGMPDDDVRPLLPHLVAALEWMRDHGDADGDGLLEYVDTTGHGLANQGWKDSSDSVQWRDGSLADGPIALCEVQAYAYEAAMHGADLLDHFGAEGGDGWREWARVLQTRFRESLWIASPDGDYPAIALDVRKRPVDTVTSNIGHLLGTGLLDAREATLVAARLSSPHLSSGYGLRTMSSDSSGYWPLSYHGGSVWTHDTAIAISGLVREGHRDVALELTSGLLAAASGFDYRMPELHSGDSAADFSRPIPYPAACRPQAWSAAASVSVLASLLGLDPDAQAGVLGVSPSADRIAPISVTGLRFAGSEVSLVVDGAGEVSAASGATVEVR